MSLDHQYMDKGDEDEELLEKKHRTDLQDFQIKNMYDYQKHQNPHDIAGAKGIVEAQNQELNIKKVQFRMANENYLREHPELNIIISVFLFKVLEEKPQNILSYAGKFFDQEKLEEIIEIEKEHYINNKYEQ